MTGHGRKARTLAFEKAQKTQETLPTDVGYVEKVIGLGLLFALIAGCVLVLAPFWKSLFLAVTLCVSTWASFKRLDKAFGRRHEMAAFVMIVLMAFLLITPIFILVSNFATDAAQFGVAARESLRSGMPPPSWLAQIPFMGPEAARVWTQASQQGAQFWSVLQPYFAPIRDWTLAQGASVVSGMLQLVFAIVLAFFLYRDGDYVESRVEWALSRLGGWRAQHMLQIARMTIVSVVRGVLGTAVIQAVLLGMSFWLAGIPAAAAIGALAMVLSLAPLGIAILWIPAALWLMSQGHTDRALLLIAWNGLIVSSLDNFLRPYLIGRGVRLPTVLVFLGVLGGMLAIGLVGVFIGPVILAVSYTLFQDWGQPRADSVEDL